MYGLMGIKIHIGHFSHKMLLDSHSNAGFHGHKDSYLAIGSQKLFVSHHFFGFQHNDGLNSRAGFHWYKDSHLATGLH